MRKRVAVIGAGFVGTMAAQRIAERNLADVVLADIVEGLPQGKALDIRQAGTLEGMDVSVTGTNDFSLVKGSDVVVFTAGFPRTPGMTREELCELAAFYRRMRAAADKRLGRLRRIKYRYIKRII